MLDIHSIMHGLAEKRPIFHREEDFQFALAWQIKEIDPSAEIRLEFNPFPDEQHRSYLDIFVKSEGTAIELKYPTERTDFEHQGERFAPGTKGLGDKGLYSCVEDISRLERAIEHPDINFGLFVLLTNREVIWRGSSRVANDDDFRLHKSRKLEGKLVHKTDKYDPINLRWAYNLRWHHYRNLKTVDNSKLHEGHHQFRYLAVEVGN